MSALSEFLAHYGVKGMKWDESKRKLTPEEKAELRRQQEEARLEKRSAAEARKLRKGINEGVEKERKKAKRGGRQFDEAAAKERIGALFQKYPGLTLKKIQKEERYRKWREKIKAKALSRELRERRLRLLEQGESMDIDAVEEFLAHYGIKGMRWGVRRKNPSGTSSSKASADATTAKRLLGKSMSELSNDDLKTLNTRMRLEREYRSLNPKVDPLGQRILNRFLKKYSESAVDDAAKRAAKASNAFLLEEIKKRRGVEANP